VKATCNGVEKELLIRIGLGTTTADGAVKGLQLGVKQQNFTATLTPPTKFSKFYIVFNETLTHPKTNGSFSDLIFDVAVERRQRPLIYQEDFNHTVLNYTDR
jgi:hypothetical protein